jgi:hypothetical protein
MDLKKRIAKIKTQIKEHQNEIITAGFILTTAAATVGWALTLDKLGKAYAGNRRLIEEAQSGAHYGPETVYLAEETTDELLAGSKDIWFEVRGKRCDLTLHSED